MVLPKADSQQEAVVLLLQKRVEVLKQKLLEVEREQQRKLTDGKLYPYSAHTHTHTLLTITCSQPSRSRNRLLRRSLMRN